MLVTIRHVTTYRYETPVRYAVQALRLTPPSFSGQRVVDWRIESAGYDKAARFRDGFGNEVALVSTSAPHDTATIVAAGTVETGETCGVTGAGLVEPAPLRVFLRMTEMTAPDEAIQDIASASRRRSSLETLHDLMGRVAGALYYAPGVTHAHTSAAEALAEGRGVCQDHAHVMIGAARALAIPARYVNGYLLDGSNGPSEAHHAWMEAWVEGLGWVGFDAANRTCPTDRYVRLATGLDARSAAPIRGLRRGAEKEALDVAVEVQQQVAEQ